jgi:hypothetical protein
MELHAPGSLADAESLRADGVSREEDAVGRNVERVAVPLEGVEAIR